MLEVGSGVFFRPVHGAGYAVELQLEAVNIQRTGNDPLDVPAQSLAQNVLPFSQPRLGSGEYHPVMIGGNGQNLTAGCVLIGNERQQPFNRGNVEFERINP